MTSNTVSGDSTPIVIALLFIWLILVLALVFFYKKLNKDTNGQYDIHRLIFAEGGLQDQLRQGVGVVENRLGVRIWPQPHEEEEGLRDNEGRDEEDVNNDKQNESHAEEEEEEEEENHDIKDDSSDDYSSIDLRERANQRKEDKNGEKTEAEEDKEKQQEAEGNDDKHDKELKNEEKVGLLVDFKPFAGSAIWSEQSRDEGNDLTAL